MFLAMEDVPVPFAAGREARSWTGNQMVRHGSGEGAHRAGGGRSIHQEMPVLRALRHAMMVAVQTERRQRQHDRASSGVGYIAILHEGDIAAMLHPDALFERRALPKIKRPARQATFEGKRCQKLIATRVDRAVGIDRKSTRL